MNAVEILALGSSPKRAASAEVGAPNKEEASFLGEFEALDDRVPVSESVKADADVGKAASQDEGDVEVEVADLAFGQSDTQPVLSEEEQFDAVMIRPGDGPVPQADAENAQLPVSLSPSEAPSKGGALPVEIVASGDGTSRLIGKPSNAPGIPPAVAATSEHFVQPSSAAVEAEESKPHLAPAVMRSEGQKTSQDGNPRGQGKDQRQPQILGEVDGQPRSDLAASKSIPGTPSFGLEMPTGSEVQKLPSLGKYSELASQRSVDQDGFADEMRPKSVDAPSVKTAAAADPSLPLASKGPVSMTTDGPTAFSVTSSAVDVSPFSQGMTERLAASSPSGLPNAIQLQTPQGVNSSQIAQAISVHLDAAPKPGEPGHLELRLEPEELGKLRITFTPRETGILVSFTAERNETLELIRRNGEALLEDFEKIDLAGSELAFDMQGNDNEWQGADEIDGSFAAENNPNSDRPVSGPIILAGIGDDRLDIRL